MEKVSGSKMYITNDAFNEIVEKVPNNPPETGGILGGNDNIVQHVLFDKDVSNQEIHKCHYAPNVKYLNECILEWSKRKIDFYGIFHTHFYGVSTLSDGDKCYIEKIMFAMPALKIKLFFPVIVLPNRDIISYVCIKDKGKAVILEDAIHLL